MAHFLRGQFRENEGELIGALLLFRKAAEAYDPEAHDPLDQRLPQDLPARDDAQPPGAARAALERAVHFQPGDPDIRAQFEGEFGDGRPAARRGPQEVHLPPHRQAGRRRPPPPASSPTPARRSSNSTQLTPDDPAAWFNLGVVLAWLGEQPKAVEALAEVDRPGDRRPPGRGGRGAGRGARCGHGMENDADYLAHGFVMPIRDPNAVMQLLRPVGPAEEARGVPRQPGDRRHGRPGRRGDAVAAGGRRHHAGPRRGQAGHRQRGHPA